MANFDYLNTLPPELRKALSVEAETPDEDINAVIPSSDQKAALAGTNGTPSDSNRYVTNSDPRNTNARTPTPHFSTHQTGGSDAIPVATPSLNGLLSSTDKQIIDHVALESPLSTRLWVDKNTTVPLASQDGSVRYPYATIQQAINFAAASSLVSWHINVGFGTYTETLTIPKLKDFVIEGVIRRGAMTINGAVNWTVTGDRTSRLGFKNIIVNGAVNVIDDTVPAINAVLTWENSQCTGVTASGSSFVTISMGGATLASFTAVITPVVAAVVRGPINLNYGTILADGVQFESTCTIINCGILLCAGCSFDQNITLSGIVAQLSDCVWRSAKTLTFTGSTGSLFTDEVSANSFIDTGSSLVNGKHVIATQRSTGWITGGVVTKVSGRDVNITAGSGYRFQFDDVTDYVTWATNIITLPANQLLDIYVDNMGTILSGAHPIDQRNVIILATAFTSSSDVIMLSRNKVETTQVVPQISQYLQSVIGPIHVSGVAATIYSPPSKQITVDSGSFYIGFDLHSAAASSPITFTLWYRNGSGGWTTVTGQTMVNTSVYDDGSGVPALVTGADWKKDSLFVVVGGSGTEYHLVLAQELYSSQSAAEAGDLPNAPEALSTSSLRTGGIVSNGGDTKITSITDERPRVGQLASGSTATSDHGLLSGLSDDDHPQYQLRSEENMPNGYVGLNASSKILGSQQVYGSIVNTATEGNDSRIPTQSENDALQGTDGSPSNSNRYVTSTDPKLPSQAENDALQGTNGSPSNTNRYVTDSDSRNTNARVPTSHGASHSPISGSDPIAFDFPVEITDSTNATGIGNAYAIHSHQHAHGNRGGGTLHALAVASGAAGFLSGSDKSKLDGLPSSAVPTSRNLTAGSGLTGGGDLSSDRTFNIGAGDGISVAADSVAVDASVVRTSRNLVAGSGLIGGGDLSFDRSFSVGANADGSIVVNSDDVQVGVLATDAQHGVRGGGTQHAVVISGGSSGFMTGADKLKLDGISSGAAALTSSAPSDVTKSTASVGVGTTAARFDHKHDISTATPTTIGTSNTEGSATSLARSDHIHSHGNQAGGSLHADVIASGASGFMTGADKAKLDGIPSGGSLRQTVFNEITVNTTTTSTTFVSFGTMSQTITIASGSILLIYFSVGCSNSANNNNIFFRVQVDSVTKRGVGISSGNSNEPNSGSIVLRVTGLAAGLRTVSVQWRVAAGTGQVRPVTIPDAEHASLLLMEVAV